MTNATTTPTPIVHFINGQLVPGGSDRSQPVTNPSTGRVTGRVALANRADVDAAVAAAQAAFEAAQAQGERLKTAEAELKLARERPMARSAPWRHFARPCRRPATSPDD